MRLPVVLMTLGVALAAEETLAPLTWADVPEMVGDLYLGAMAAT